MLWQTVGIMVMCWAIGKWIFDLLIYGLFEGEISNLITRFLMKMHFGRTEAEEIYESVFLGHKELFQMVGFVLLFMVSYCVVLSRMAKYLKTVEQGVENILAGAKEPIELPMELQPIAEKLNILKMTLRRRDFAAQENEQRKNNLVVYLAHDLRTPLTSVIAYLSMLEEKPDMDKEERKKYIHISLGKAVRLGELIQEFFEITRFNLQDIQLEKELINVSLMLEQMVDEFYAVFSDNGLAGTVHVEDNLMVEGDPDKLARVFENLLRNAVAYSYRGTTVDVQAYQEGQTVVIVFSNQGDPIPKQKLQSIFEKFYRVDHARSSQTGGAGLGLSVAKEIVELHEGTIEAFSDAQATRFVVRLKRKTDIGHQEGRQTWKKK